MLILAGVAISVLTGDGGLFDKAKGAVGVYEQAAQNEAEQLQSIYDELDNYMGNTDQFKATFGVNAPKTTTGMIPVKYNSASGKWEKADVNGEYSFYSPYMNGSTLTWDWFKVAYDEPNSSSQRAWARSWNNDYIQAGHSLTSFVLRGGPFSGSEGVGVCLSGNTSGAGSWNYGFRSALAF